MTDTEIRAYLAERWSRSQPKEAALDYMADGTWEDRRETCPGGQRPGPVGETQGGTGQIAAPQLRTTTRWPASRGMSGAPPSAGATPRRCLRLPTGREASSGGLRRSTRAHPHCKAIPWRLGLLTRRRSPGTAVLLKQAARPSAPGRTNSRPCWPERGGYRPQGPRRLRGPPCPGAAPPAGGDDAAHASDQAGGGTTGG